MAENTSFASSCPGVLLEGEFDQGTDHFLPDLARFGKSLLRSLEAMGTKHFILAQKREGVVLKLAVIPCSVDEASADPRAHHVDDIGAIERNLAAQSHSSVQAKTSRPLALAAPKAQSRKSTHARKH